jgi:Ala-tRNA(Pro) deacylase
MPVQKLKDYLDKNRVTYVSIRHSTAYTASAVAASAHVKGKNLAKTVIVKLDGKLTMAVLPAKYRVDLEALRAASLSGSAELATEEEFAKTFPTCEEGAMPPFGNLYGVPVYVDRTLAEDEEIAFNACSHSELIQLPYETFARLVKPKVASFKTED